MTNAAEHTIDAAGRSLGRVASEAAKMLMGKTTPAYTPHIPLSIRVNVLNASKIAMSERKRVSKTYATYSGYPGGLKKETFSALAARTGGVETIRRAVRRMLPRNKLLVGRMKNLVITK